MEKLYTTAEAGDYLKVGELTIRRYIKAGKIESQKVGRQHRIPETAIKKFLDAQGGTFKKMNDEEDES